MFDNKVSMHNNMKLFGSMDSRFQDFVLLLRLVEHQLHQLLPTVNHLVLLGADHLKDLILVVDIFLKNKHKPPASKTKGLRVWADEGSVLNSGMARQAERS